MNNLEYSAKDALALLLRKLDPVAPELLVKIQAAINAGRDEQLEESIRSKRPKKSRKRFYRKHRAFTDPEALKVAIDVLESHLIENRMMVNAAHLQFQEVGAAAPVKAASLGQTGIYIQPPLPSRPGESTPPGPPLRAGEPKSLVIESEPESVQEKRNLPDLPLIITPHERLASLEHVFQNLRELTNFKELRHGNVS